MHEPAAGSSPALPQPTRDHGPLADELLARPQPALPVPTSTPEIEFARGRAAERPQASRGPASTLDPDARTAGRRRETTSAAPTRRGDRNAPPSDRSPRTRRTAWLRTLNWNWLPAGDAAVPHGSYRRSRVTSAGRFVLDAASARSPHPATRDRCSPSQSEQVRTRAQPSG